MNQNKIVRHDYNGHQRSNLQFKFCRNNIFEKDVNNMGIKLCNKLLYHLKEFKEYRTFYKDDKILFVAADFVLSRIIFVLQSFNMGTVIVLVYEMRTYFRHLETERGSGLVHIQSAVPKCTSTLSK